MYLVAAIVPYWMARSRHLRSGLSMHFLAISSIICVWMCGVIFGFEQINWRYSVLKSVMEMECVSIYSMMSSWPFVHMMLMLVWDGLILCDDMRWDTSGRLLLVHAVLK